MDGITQFSQFVTTHKGQLEASKVPSHLWKALYYKLKEERFDAVEVFRLLLVDYDEDEDPVSEDEMKPVFLLEVCKSEGIKKDDPNAIFLIDHAWTYRADIARQQLEDHEHLTNRMCAITGVDLSVPDRIDQILKIMWRYSESYTIAGNNIDDSNRLPIWYIMDEVGCAVIHSEDPNFRIVPFLDQTSQTTYSLMFPIKNVECGEQITRDFLEYVSKEAPERSALLLPWVKSDFSEKSFIQTEPGEDYFLHGHIRETNPVGDATNPQVDRSRPLKVYSEYSVIREYLTDDCFEVVEDESEADILWLNTHYREFEELSSTTPNKFINQFPFEYVITIKDLLSICCRRKAIEHHNEETLETYPKWLPTTFNLKTEIIQFAAYFQKRQLRNLDNHWIIKPWNLARGLDMQITNFIEQIMRLPATGPKIAQKYIDRPVLYYREDIQAKVKFDIRYVILVKSVHPLKAYVHRRFFLRFANREFSLDHFDKYEKHFTVMNYSDEVQLHHLKCEDFKVFWQEQYPSHPWDLIEKEICKMLNEMLLGAQMLPPPRGIAACPQSRALYAADIMLEWNNNDSYMQPKLLEVNWCPDCKRACYYYPNFFNDIFKLLFFDIDNDKEFLPLNSEE